MSNDKVVLNYLAGTNFLKYKNEKYRYKATTANGITWITNSDNSITINGELDPNYVNNWYSFGSYDTVTLPFPCFIYGLPSNISTTYLAFGGGGIEWAQNGQYIPANRAVTVKILIGKGYYFDNVTIYPRLVPAYNDYDYNNYEYYSQTVPDISKRIVQFNQQFEAFYYYDDLSIDNPIAIYRPGIFRVNSYANGNKYIIKIFNFKSNYGFTAWVTFRYSIYALVVNWHNETLSGYKFEPIANLADQSINDGVSFEPDIENNCLYIKVNNAWMHNFTQILTVAEATGGSAQTRFSIQLLPYPSE